MINMVIRMRRKESDDSFDFRPFGKAMRTARKDEGWTQGEAAERLGIEQPYYQRLEAGYGQKPGLALFYRIIRLYQISVDEYFFPNVAPEKSTTYRRIEALLDKMDDDELIVIEGIARLLLGKRK